MDRQRRVAFHEAAHAITARELGLTVDWIERNADGSGQCRISIPGSVYDEATVYAAGAMAESFKSGLPVAPSPDDTLGMRRVSRKERLAAIDRASEILQAHWADVEALAARLLADPDGFLPLPFAPDQDR